jgi:hypothetical protein
MNSIYKLVLSSGLATVGLFGLQGSATAVTSINANACQPTELTPGIIRSGGFIQNVGANNRTVICPVMRIAEAPANGWSVFVDGNAPATGSLSCQLESYSFTNKFLGAVSFVARPGNFDETLTLPPEKVPKFSHQALFCSLPPNGSLFDIEPITN